MWTLSMQVLNEHLNTLVLQSHAVICVCSVCSSFSVLILLSSNDFAMFHVWKHCGSKGVVGG